MADFRSEYPSSFEAVGHARREIVGFARILGFCDPELQDIEIAVGEALANAAEHGFVKGSTIGVTANFSGTSLTIEVKDRGNGFADWLSGSVARSSDSPRGFGITIMRSLMDHVAFLDGGNRICLTKRMKVDVLEADRREA